MDSFLNLYRTGRLGRLQYFFLSLIASVVMWIPTMIFTGGPEKLVGLVNSANSFRFVVTQVLLLAISALVALHLSVRRLHDIGLSGWWTLLPIGISFIPTGGTAISTTSLTIALLQMLIGAVLLFWPGAKTENQYGPVPSTDRKLVQAYLNK
ncbi:MAG: DUF805 domain-containing protein [bacterium]|nr:DUF805 domain-containing protein [bacterium]